MISWMNFLFSPLSPFFFFSLCFFLFSLNSKILEFYLPETSLGGDIHWELRLLSIIFIGVLGLLTHIVPFLVRLIWQLNTCIIFIIISILIFSPHNRVVASFNKSRSHMMFLCHCDLAQAFLFISWLLVPNSLYD